MVGASSHFFSTLSTAHSFALQTMRESSLKNPKCNKTRVGRGFDPDRNDPLTSLGELTALPDPLVGGYGFTTTPQEPHPGSSSPLSFELTLPPQC